MHLVGGHICNLSKLDVISRNLRTHRDTIVRPQFALRLFCAYVWPSVHASSQTVLLPGHSRPMINYWKWEIFIVFVCVHTRSLS